MAHPELLEPAEKRKSKLSPLMQAQAKAASGVKVNFCQHGCADDDLDENGYCDHLIGFTNDGKVGPGGVVTGTFERMVMIGDRRVVQVPRVPSGKKDHAGKDVLVPRLEPIPKGAKLVPISSSSRVYVQEAKTA